jgi:hypothetical protein
MSLPPVLLQIVIVLMFRSAANDVQVRRTSSQGVLAGMRLRGIGAETETCYR